MVMASPLGSWGGVWSHLAAAPGRQKAQAWCGLRALDLGGAGRALALQVHPVYTHKASPGGRGRQPGCRGKRVPSTRGLPRVWLREETRPVPGILGIPDLNLPHRIHG